jgi:hypothetical protein
LRRCRRRGIGGALLLYLPPCDDEVIDQVIRTVSRESIFPILYITREKMQGSDQVVVYTDFSHNPQRYMVYRLQKTNGRDWRIVWHGEGMAIYVWKT